MKDDKKNKLTEIQDNSSICEDDADYFPFEMPENFKDVLDMEPVEIIYVRYGDEEKILEYLPRTVYIIYSRRLNRVTNKFKTFFETYITLILDDGKVVHYYNNSKIYSREWDKWRDIPEHILQAVKKRMEELGEEKVTNYYDYIYSNVPVETEF